MNMPPVSALASMFAVIFLKIGAAEGGEELLVTPPIELLQWLGWQFQPRVEALSVHEDPPVPEVLHLLSGPHEHIVLMDRDKGHAAGALVGHSQLEGEEVSK